MATATTAYRRPSRLGDGRLELQTAGGFADGAPTTTHHLCDGLPGSAGAYPARRTAPLSDRWPRSLIAAGTIGATLTPGEVR